MINMFPQSKGYHFLVLFFLYIILFTACSPKISNFAAHNRYVKNFNTHILNDSLQLHLITPADITYYATRTSIKQALKKEKIKVKNEVLLFGTTKSPNYKVLVTIGPQKEVATTAHQIIIDTTIYNRKYHVIGQFTNKVDEQSVTADIKQIFNRLKTGKNYLDEITSVMDIVNGALNKNQFFKTLTEIRQFEIPKNQSNSLEMQMQLTYASFLGNNEVYKNLIAQQEQFFKPKDSILRVIKNNTLDETSSLAEIIKLAKMTNMVMINENHYYPNQRLLMLALLPKLKDMGYTYLALEALGSPADSLLNLPLAYPKLNSGFYTMEQNYGNLLREAKKLGYHFVAYENTDVKKDREIGQAENLYNRTIAKNKNAKVLVIAGIDHILELPTANGKKWLATILKENYQLDPLTISQTHLNDYRKFSPYKYQLLAKEELNQIKNLAAVDYFVLNNQSEPPQLWNNKLKYINQNKQVVQISLFYEKEINNESAYQLNIPYFSSLVVDKQLIILPFNDKEKALMVVYDRLGNVLEKRNIN